MAVPTSKVELKLKSKFDILNLTKERKRERNTNAFHILTNKKLVTEEGF